MALPPNVVSANATKPRYVFMIRNNRVKWVQAASRFESGDGNEKNYEPMSPCHMRYATNESVKFSLGENEALLRARATREKDDPAFTLL